MAPPHHIFSNGKGQPMVIEWLALWGVAEATAFVFEPILEDLAKDAAKGMAGEYIKLARGWRTDADTLAFLEVKE